MELPQDGKPRHKRRTTGAIHTPVVRFADGTESRSYASVVVEDTMTLDVKGVGSYTLMWTPTTPAGEAVAYTCDDHILGEITAAEILALPVGFLYSEGLIETVRDIRLIASCPDNPKRMAVELREPGKAAALRRSAMIASSCGICGEGEVPEISDIKSDHIRRDLAISSSTLNDVMTQMRLRQHVFDQTGGTHAAAVFTSSSEVLVVGEDLGRHNALDKVIGHCLLNDVDLTGCGVALSSRLSFEMIHKAVRAGFQVVCAVSAPTSLAIKLATRAELTLCGFVRSGECTVYCGDFRLK